MGDRINRSKCASYRIPSHSVLISSLAPRLRRFLLPPLRRLPGPAILSGGFSVLSTLGQLPPLASCFLSSGNTLLSLFPSDSPFPCEFVPFLLIPSCFSGVSKGGRDKCISLVYQVSNNSRFFRSTLWMTDKLNGYITDSLLQSKFHNILRLGKYLNFDFYLCFILPF